MWPGVSKQLGNSNRNGSVFSNDARGLANFSVFGWVLCRADAFAGRCKSRIQFTALDIPYTNLLSVSGKRFLLNSELRLFFVLVFLAFEFFFSGAAFNKLNTAPKKKLKRQKHQNKKQSERKKQKSFSRHESPTRNLQTSRVQHPWQFFPIWSKPVPISIIIILLIIVFDFVFCV